MLWASTSERHPRNVAIPAVVGLRRRGAEPMPRHRAARWSGVAWCLGRAAAANQPDWAALLNPPAYGAEQTPRGASRSLVTLPLWNATSHADRHGHGYPSAPAMQHSGGADLTAGNTVSTNCR